MQPSPETRPSLLVRIRDAQDGPAWGLFVEVYAPLIHGYLRKRGLQDADAADVTQEVLRRVAQAIRRFEYDPHRGAFRGWLFTVVRNQWRTFLERKHEQGSGDSATMQLLLEQPAPEDDSSWDTEYQRRLFRWAARKVQADVNESTWQAFWLTSLEGKSGPEVAQVLSMSVAAVYVARSRVLARLRDLVQQMEGSEIPHTGESSGPPSPHRGRGVGGEGESHV
jgi:RNA polymerase sigma-70 factor (ECF subfamily)